MQDMRTRLQSQSRLWCGDTDPTVHTVRESGNPRGSEGALVPLPRVMGPSPTRVSGAQSRTACHICAQPLRGPVSLCAACGLAVHPQCSVGYMHDMLCERCFTDFSAVEAARRQQQEGARRLGLLGARGSEALGSAFGAVGAAGAAASRYFVHGALAGAQSAWTGAAVVAPGPPAGLQVSIPRPDYLPPPLPATPSSASSAPVASEDVG